MKLSVLDQSTAAKDRGPDDAIRETLALARAFGLAIEDQNAAESLRRER